MDPDRIIPSPMAIEPYKNWSPIPHNVIKDRAMRDEIHLEGFTIKQILAPKEIDSLFRLYHDLHQLESAQGGMFYSVYSKDLEYRANVHREIGKIVEPCISKLLKDYKVVLNSFVVKTPGPKSAFYLHQDTTALDEFKYSGLSIWIALQDTGPENGGMNLIPRSHWLSSPYRGVTMPFPFKKIESTVREYLQPIRLKAGQALIFDQRLIHDSSVNSSKEDRVAVVSGIFPKSAEFITCYKDQSNVDNPIELHRHGQDYLLKYPKFYYDCHDRPTHSEVIDTIPDDFPEISQSLFKSFCNNNGLSPQPEVAAFAGGDFISEPQHDIPKEKNIVSFFKSLFN